MSAPPARHDEVVIVSDWHLSARRLYEAGRAWFRPRAHRDRLLRFLDAEVLAPARRPGTLLLLGDIFDDWQTPIEQAPPTWDEVLESNPALVAALAEASAQGVEVIWTPGNHDFELDRATLRAHLPGLRVTERLVWPGALWAEHGHELTLLNATDLEPREGRPLGYFLGRLHDRLPCGFGPRSLWHYIRRGALRRVWGPNYLGDILAAGFGVAGVAPGDEVVLRPGAVTARELVARYSMAGHRLPVRARIWRLLQRPLAMCPAAALEARRAGCPVVVMGHTHEAGIWRLPGVLGVNAGAWCQAHAHAVRVAHGGRRVEVELARVDLEGRAHRVAHATVAAMGPA